MAFDFLCSSASFLTLSAMSIERYKMLTTSYIHIKNSSKFRIIVFIILSWCLPFFTWIPTIIGFRVFTGFKNRPGDECIVPANKYLILALSVILYHIPLICMVTFYTKLIIHIKKSSLQNLELNENFSYQTSNFSQNRVQNKQIIDSKRFTHSNVGDGEISIHSNHNSLALPCNGINKIENAKLNKGQLAYHNSLKLKKHVAQNKSVPDKKLFTREKTGFSCKW